MIARLITKHLDTVARYFPVVTILGPRQSGKTTLAKAHFPRYTYVNLEKHAERQLALKDPEEFLRLFPAPVIIDEVQRVPELLSHIQVVVDQQKKMGQFILTGSHQPQLHAGITQSLAGRTGLLTLLPLSIAELSQAKMTMDRDEYLLKGFMPRVHSEGVPPGLLYSNYYQTYVERDVRQLINVANQHAFELFVKLLAGRVGQLVNLNSLSNDVGVSVPTLSSWLSVLEASFIVFRLPSYHTNMGKRLVKTPKIYFTDVGLACFLLGIQTVDQVARDPALGGLFENMVVVEALKACYNTGQQPNLYFMRDSKGFEVDLLFVQGRRIVPIEIKASRSYDSSFTVAVEKLLQLLPHIATPTVIYSGQLTPKVNHTQFLNFTQTATLFGAS
jgi:predicted AAA+ superfamily ATPase